MWPDGSRYEGEWLGGVMHGYGTMTWSPLSAWPGDKYEGEWSYGLMEGDGVYMKADGTQYDGPWRAGMRTQLR